MVFPSCSDSDSVEVNTYVDNLLEPHGRLSMAYCFFSVMPLKISSRLGNRVENFDLSNNKFTDLSFLVDFKCLHTLILDRNPNPDVETLPSLPLLRILWINNCNIANINKWLYKLKDKCPNLDHLSMMCNPVGETQLNGVNEDAEEEYRIDIIRILPKLVILDGSRITNELRRKANGMCAEQRQVKLKNDFDTKLKKMLLMTNDPRFGLNWRRK